MLVIGRGGGVARAVVEAARAAGAKVIAAGRDAEKLRSSYDNSGIAFETVDITDDAAILALGEESKAQLYGRRPKPIQPVESGEARI